jgi:hypothetical protein
VEQACRVALVATYVYRGTRVPKPGDERACPNLWRYGGAAPSDIQPVEIVVESFACAP